MKNILLFIRRFFTLFLFLFLQVLCITFLVKYNQSYSAAYSNVAHSVTGSIDKRYNNIQYFFQLKQTNKSLADENAKLRTALGRFVAGADTLNSDKLFSITDSFKIDSVIFAQKYEYSEAKVVSNAAANDNNFITIEKGSNQGIKKDMAVISPAGVVGRVVAVSPNYSIVMSLLNPSTRIMASVKGLPFNQIYIDWNGKQANIVQLNNLSKNIPIKKGDTVVTGNRSDFPENMMIGRIIDYSVNPVSGFYNINVATATNFYALQYVYVIKNNFIKEQRALEESIIQKP